MDSLRLFSIIPLVKQWLATSARSFIITRATILRTLFGIPSGPRALLFRRLLISLLISSIKIVGLILSALYSIIASSSILLRSAVPVLGKNLVIKMSTFMVLLSVKGSLIDLLRSSR